MKFVDLTGQTFGELTVLKRANNDKYGNSRYLCRCSCGTELIVDSSTLKRGGRKSCGHKYRIPIGSRFGKLVVLEEIKTKGKYTYKCLCDCGNIVVISKYYLVNGHNKSCSCGKGYKTHGMSRSRIYSTWTDMKQRCFNPNCNNYHNYGSRGIRVCDDWMNFEPFYEWAIKNGYSDELTIERINVNGNYEPSNCTWIPLSEQNKNKRPKSK